MWRLALSGLLCLPALVLLLLNGNDDTQKVPPKKAALATPPIAAIQVSLPPLQFSTEPGLPDPGTWDDASLIVRLPLHEELPGASIAAPAVALSISQLLPGSYLAMRRHTTNTRTRGFAVFETTSRAKHHASQSTGLLAFLSRNLTRHAFAPPDQNGGG